MKQPFLTTTFLAFLGGAVISCPAFARADNTGVQAALVSRPELSMFLQAMHESGVYSELSQDQSYTIFAPVDDAFAKVTAANTSCAESADCRMQLAAIIRNHIVPAKNAIAALAKQKDVSTLGARPLHIENPSQPNDGHKVDGFKIVGMHETETALVYSLDGPVVTEKELGAMSAPANGPSGNGEQPAADKPHGNAALAPIIPARPSLVAPPSR